MKKKGWKEGNKGKNIKVGESEEIMGGRMEE